MSERAYACVYVRTYLMCLFLNLLHNVLRMCVYCVYVDEELTFCVFVDMYMYVCMHIRVCMVICTSVRMYVCVLYMYVCMQV